MIKTGFVLIFFFHIFSIAAQNHVTAGAEVSAGGKHFSPGKTGIGASIEYIAKAFPNAGIRVYAAYNQFSNQAADKRLQFIPVRVGYQHFLYSDNLFVYAEAGVTNFLFSSNTKTKFSAAGGVGYKLNIPEANLAQVSLFYNYNRYQSSVDYNWFTLRAAYGIKFGKRKAFKREE